MLLLSFVNVSSVRSLFAGEDPSMSSPFSRVVRFLFAFAGMIECETCGVGADGGVAQKRQNGTIQTFSDKFQSRLTFQFASTILFQEGQTSRHGCLSAFNRSLVVTG